MNLTELSRLDIKDLKKIDYNKLLLDVRKRPDILVAVGLVLLTLFFSVNAFTKRKQELLSLQQQIGTLEAKITVIENYEKAKKDLADFVAQIPESLLDNNLINT